MKSTDTRRQNDLTNCVTERVFNILLDVEGDLIVSIGAQPHNVSGDDDTKISYLLERVEEDAQTATRFLLPPNVYNVDSPRSPRTLLWATYLQLCELGMTAELFEPMLAVLDAPREPVLVVTPIIEGKPCCDGRMKIRTTNADSSKLAFYTPKHFLQRYTENNTFQFSSLLNDDFFKPIKLLVNNGYIVSGMKLLLSAIDTFAFLEYGDKKDVFKLFVSTYFDLDRTEISAEELWELRNGLVHMTNNDSRQVKKGNVKSIVLFRGKLPVDLPTETFDGKRLEVDSLFFETAHATERWGIELFAKGAESIQEFVSRYETLISENHAWKMEWA